MTIPPNPHPEQVEAAREFEPRYVAGSVPTDCCNYAVVSRVRGKEVCRVWDADDAILISKLLNASLANRPADEELGQGCTIPPDGWWCSREPGHEGPCAARRIGTLDLIMSWYRGLPETVRRSLSLHDLHKLSKSMRLANRPADDGELEQAAHILARVPVSAMVGKCGWKKYSEAEAGLQAAYEAVATRAALPPQPEGARCPLCDAIYPQPHICERRGSSDPATYDAPREKAQPEGVKRP